LFFIVVTFIWIAKVICSYAISEFSPSEARWARRWHQLHPGLLQNPRFNLFVVHAQPVERRTVWCISAVAPGLCPMTCATTLAVISNRSVRDLNERRRP